MAKIQVWMEGYIVTGGRGTAQLLGEYEAENFDAAIEQYNKNYEADEFHMPAVRDGLLGNDMKPLDCWTIWGCRLYDNETDARRSFG